MSAAATTTVSSGVSSRPSWIILNMYARVGEYHNETTADGIGTNGERIRASLVRERPPLPSNLYVCCSGGATFAEPPSSLSMVDDLILFHAYIGPPTRPRSALPSYFFIYRADPERPSLKLLSHPRGRVSRLHNPFGIFPRGEDHYTIASLNPLPSDRNFFSLCVYDSETDAWTFKKLSVESPQKDFPVPIPEKFYRMFSHHTSAVLTLGDTIGWVDLWRGIVFCDMLSDEKHTLSGIPLPLPFKCIEGDVDLGSARTHRGIAFVGGHLRLVEVGLKATDEWPCSRIKNWTITTWTNTRMSNSYDDWHMDGTFQASDISLSDHSESELPPIALQKLLVTDPIIGMNENDRHVIYLTAREKFMHPKSWFLAIDTRDRKVQSVTVTPDPLPTEMKFIAASYCTCSISK